MKGQGFSNKRIARALQISPETVKSHVKHIFLKLTVSTRTEGSFELHRFGSCEFQNRCLLTHASADA